jgi:hypothetical protein
MMDETAGLTLAAESNEPAATGRFWEHVLGGAVLAIVAFALVLYSAYHGWVVSDLSSDWAYAGVGFGFLFFALGAFVFAFGWEGGDMQRAVRLTFFICLVMLATVIALLVLLKSKGTAAKAAGKVGSAATSTQGYDVAPVIHAVASMFEDEDAVEDEAKDAASETLFQIKCAGCGATFAPTPPAGKCPFCGEAALAV